MAASDQGSSISARPGSDPAKREGVYGPLRFSCFVKGDGRALTIYTHGGCEQDGPAQDGPGNE
jgi:hypothetical protein